MSLMCLPSREVTRFFRAKREEKRDGYKSKLRRSEGCSLWVVVMRDRAGILHLFVVVSEGFNCSIVPYAFYLACEAGRVWFHTT